MVFGGAKVHDGRAEEAPLHAGFDLQRGVGGDQFLEAGDVAAVVVRAAQTRGEGAVDSIVVHQELQLLEDAGAVLRVVESLDFLHGGVARHFTGLMPDVGPFTQELLAERRDIDHGFGGSGVVAACRLVGR
ncbi:hypothetical protein ABIA52_002006 [Paenarthrobacter histidinolovorans]|uniref:Uncharacterized protein n=1 Tax=Paenarthrobacter histidinolovorans TaxID=43664 RepID=A0ABW8N6A0_9MICC